MSATRESIDVDFELESDAEMSLSDSDILVEASPSSDVEVAPSPSAALAHVEVAPSPSTAPAHVDVARDSDILIEASPPSAVEVAPSLSDAPSAVELARDSDIFIDASLPSAVEVAPAPILTSAGPALAVAPQVAVAPLAPPEAPRRVPMSSSVRPPSTAASLSPLSSRLPPVSPPPLARRPSMPAAEELGDPAEAIETLPLPMKSPFETTEKGHVPRAAIGPIGGSIAPITFPNNDATFILRPQRARTRRSTWAVAAAALVAVAAATVTHFVVRTERSPSAASSLRADPTALEPTPVVAPVLVTPAVVTSAEAPAVVRFAEDEGVTIDVPAAPAHAAAKPVTPTPDPSAASHAQAGHSPAVAPLRPRNSNVYRPPMMPDGSLGLASKPAAASPAPISPTSARKRALTPEQELAEAQLRAAAR